MALPPFFDLMSELQAVADDNKGLSPHEIARKFVLEESARRGGVEVVVATDKDGKFLGAGTQNSAYFISFPPSIKDSLDDPKANIFIHHNHPPGQNQFLSPKEDMASLANHVGIGWMLLHTNEIYSAMRATNRMFEPDASSGARPRDWLSPAYDMGVLIARREMHGKVGVTEDILEDGAPELALRALRQVGAIEYHSNIQTGLSHEFEQTVVREVHQQGADSPRIGGTIVWSAPEKPTLSATPGRIAASGGADGLSTAHPVTLEFNRYVDFVSRQNAAAPDPGEPGRSQLPKLPGTGGEDSGLASGGPARRPVLESRLSSAKAAPT